MSHVWMEQGEDWSLISLDGDAFSLGSMDDRTLKRGRLARSADVLLLRCGAHRKEAWALMAGRTQVWINGLPVSLGVRILRDKDQISMTSGLRMFYSDETLPLVHPFPSELAGTRCARCDTEIEPGSPSVRCPWCGTWFHQQANGSEEDLPCWTYSEACPVDRYPTTLTGGFRWTPTDL